jgi:arginine/lysine/ornithine decarboxylase
VLAALNTILFLKRPAIEPGECASLISGLAAFKQLYDADADLSQALPPALATYPERCAS